MRSVRIAFAWLAALLVWPAIALLPYATSARGGETALQGSQVTHDSQWSSQFSPASISPSPADISPDLAEDLPEYKTTPFIAENGGESNGESLPDKTGGSSSPPSTPGTEPGSFDDFPESTDSPYKLGGFVRELVHGSESALPRTPGYVRYPMASYTRTRLSAGYEGENAKADLEVNGDLIFGNNMLSPEFDALWSRRTRNRLLDMEGQDRTENYLTRGDVHRLYWSYSTPKMKLSVGRQAISWGEGRFLNPLDLITPVGPFLVDIEDVQGADAIDYSYYFNSFNMIEFVAVPYRRRDDIHTSRISYQDTNALVRYKGTRGDLDYTALGGRHFHSWVWGFDLNLSLGGASLRFAYLGRGEENLREYPYYGEKLPPQVSHQIVAGASYAFFGKLRTSGEVFFNSANYSKDPALLENLKYESRIDLANVGYRQESQRAAEDQYRTAIVTNPGNTSAWNNLAQFRSLTYPVPDENDGSFFRTQGRIITKNPVLVEFSAGYDLTDLFSMTLLFIGDPVGRSFFYGPFLTYSLSEEAVLTAGAQLFSVPADREHAEFAGASPAVYSFIRWHF